VVSVISSICGSASVPVAECSSLGRAKLAYTEMLEMNRQ